MEKANPKIRKDFPQKLELDPTLKATQAPILSFNSNLGS